MQYCHVSTDFGHFGLLIVITDRHCLEILSNILLSNQKAIYLLYSQIHVMRRHLAKDRNTSIEINLIY